MNHIACQKDLFIAGRVHATVALITGVEQQYVSITLYGLTDLDAKKQLGGLIFLPPAKIKEIIAKIEPPSTVAFIKALRLQLKLILQDSVKAVQNKFIEGEFGLHCMAPKTNRIFGGVQDYYDKPTKTAQMLYDKVIDALQAKPLTEDIEMAYRQVFPIQQEANDGRRYYTHDICRSDAITKGPWLRRAS